MADIITLYDATGTALHAEEGKKYARFSMTAAANQKRLDALARLHPDAVRATIGQAEFTIEGGVSRCTDF